MTPSHERLWRAKLARPWGNLIEDHSLERVPPAERRSGWALSWMSVGIVTTLVQLLIGGLVTATAGVALGLLAGAMAALYGGLQAWLVARIAYREGTSSTVICRLYGFGVRGSAVVSSIVAFSLITFLALENALLYNGTIFAFNLPDSWASRLTIYGALTVIWVVLALFGVRLAIRVSTVLTVTFLLLLGYLLYRAGWQGAGPIVEALHFGTTGGGGSIDKFQTALVLLAGPAGALTMVVADYARYARSSRDLTILAASAPIVVDVLIVLAGTVVMLGGAGMVERYVVDRGMATPESGPELVTRISQSNTGAYFIILAGVVGFVLMFAAQAKAQVLNTYSSSLALANLFDAALSWRPGRGVMVALANLVSLGMVTGGVLPRIENWIGALGILTTSCAGVMIADYYLVRRGRPAPAGTVEPVNWAGVLSVGFGSVFSLVLEGFEVISLGFVAALACVLVLYPAMRLWVFRPSQVSPRPRGRARNGAAGR